MKTGFSRNILGVLLLSFIFSIPVFSQKTVINGFAPGAERKQVMITAPGDLITMWEKPLASGKVDSSGHFSIEVSLAEVTNVSISIDFHKTDMFLEPSKTYDIRIERMAYDEYTEVNPFIQSQNLSIEKEGRDPLELNTLIGNFNAIYSGFLMENFNALYRDRRKNLLDTFRVQLNQHFGGVKDPYFLDYAAYKMAALEQLTQYFNQAQLAKKYFTGKPVLYNNLEYMEFFNSFFSKYLTATSNVIRKMDLGKILKGPAPYASMMKALGADSVLKNDQLRELVMLKGLMEMHSMPVYAKTDVLALIGSVKEQTKYPENRVVAEDMINLLTRLMPGTKAPEFTLMNRDQKELSLKSLLGKPVVLNFWTTYCEGCLSEMDMLKPLYDKFGGQVHFVSVSADKYFSKMLYFINLKKDYIWTFVNIGDQSDVLKDYDVRTYPLFVLIDSEGKIFKYPAEFPGNGLEADLQRILEK